jgi:hypothetical protein
MAEVFPTDPGHHISLQRASLAGSTSLLGSEAHAAPPPPQPYAFPSAGCSVTEDDMFLLVGQPPWWFWGPQCCHAFEKSKVGMWQLGVRCLHSKKSCPAGLGQDLRTGAQMEYLGQGLK